MVTLAAVEALLNPRLNRVLLILQSSLPEHQFQACRKLVLDELGKSGFMTELETLLQGSRKDRQGQGRNT
jgi:hypothetical protein